MATIERLAVDGNGLVFTARMAGTLEARPVVLLHGFPQNSYEWRDLLLALADAGYRGVAPDQRGYSVGARPEGVAAYRIANLMDDVLAVADTLEMPTFDLVGHDWGGMVAWALAARHPDRVRSLTVVSTPHPTAFAAALGGGDADQVRRSSYISFFREKDKPEEALLGEDGSGAGLRQIFATTGGDEAATEEYLATLTQPGALTAALNWYRAMDTADYLGLPPIVMPTLYVWSSDDVALGRAAAEATAEFVVGRYRFEVLDGVSHWVPEAAPAELAALVLEHLADT